VSGLWWLPVAPGVRLSFQRYVLPPSGNVVGTPASLGALPVAQDDGGPWLLPLASSEAFWIGLGAAPGAAPGTLALRARAADGHFVGTAAIAITATSRLSGLPDGKGSVLAFARGGGPHGLAELRLQAPGQAPLRLRLVDPATFAARTGLPPPAPLDPEAGYRGWRLP
jgi:hypothetical protein